MEQYKIKNLYNLEETIAAELQYQKQHHTRDMTVLVIGIWKKEEI